MRTNVRRYTDQELLSRVASTAEGFVDFPRDYWLLGVRSNEDEYNRFDDKFYLFKGVEFIDVYKGTTNAGSKGLKEFHTYNKEGVAVLKSDLIVYDSHIRGLHKGKVMAYRQHKPWTYFRDNNYNDKSEEIGEEHHNIIYANIHNVSSLGGEDVDKEYINGWSLACQVFANGKEYDRFMDITEGQEMLTYCLLEEFEVA